MIKDNLEELVQPIASSFEELQNTLILKSHEHLYKYIKSDNWLGKQLATQKDLENRLIHIANQEVGKVNQEYEKSFKIALKGVNEEISKEAIERLNKIKLDNAKMMFALTKQVAEAHQRWVNKIGIQPNESVEIGKLEKSQALYERINSTLSKQELQDVAKVTYRDGKQMPFKSYMEMNARTTLNQEIGKQQMESAPNVGVVFWLCNNFEDCRPTHQEFQGKVYYDERWTSYGFDEATTKQIEAAIESRNMMSRQEVENADPFLGNCPNCRHEFMAIPIEDVVSMSDKELLKDNNFEVSKASDRKYQLSQEQRLYERKIREYKMQVEELKIRKYSSPTNMKNVGIDKDLASAESKLHEYEDKIRELVRENSDLLERDYDRESFRVMRSDLGHKLIEEENIRRKYIDILQKASENPDYYTKHQLTDKEYLAISLRKGKFMSRDAQELIKVDISSNNENATTINTRLRDGTPMEELTELEEALEKATKKQVPFDLVVHRYDNKIFINKFLGVKTNQSKEKIVEEINSKAGQVFEKKDYTYSSVSENNIFRDRKYISTILVKKGMNGYFSGNVRESELILPKNLKLRLIGAKIKIIKGKKVIVNEFEIVDS